MGLTDPAIVTVYGGAYPDEDLAGILLGRIFTEADRRNAMLNLKFKGPGTSNAVQRHVELCRVFAVIVPDITVSDRWQNFDRKALVVGLRIAFERDIPVLFLLLDGRTLPVDAITEAGRYRRGNLVEIQLDGGHLHAAASKATEKLRALLLESRWDTSVPAELPPTEGPNNFCQLLEAPRVDTLAGESAEPDKNPASKSNLNSPEAVRPNKDIRVFLCHSSGDKEEVRKLYNRLMADGISCWFDEEDLLPGQDWDAEIKIALRTCSHVLACISTSSISKTGYVQKELRQALDKADEQPAGSIFLIPVRLEDCEVPDRLRDLHYVDLFRPDAYSRLLRALKAFGDTR